MRTSNPPTDLARDLANWLVQAISDTAYGEVVLAVRCHAGREAIIEKTVTQRSKAAAGGVASDGKRKDAVSP